MTAIPDPSKQGFKFSQLLYDTRYRSMTIQIVSLIAILLFFGWLISNTAANLATLGKPIQFKFLGEPSNYDINQRLLDYIKPDFIHVLSNGKIVKTGNADLGTELEKTGYSNLA